MRNLLLSTILLSSLAFGCSHLSAAPTTPAVERQEQPPPPPPHEDAPTRVNWIEHTAGVWTFKLPPQFKQAEDVEGIDAVFKSEDDAMLIDMGAEELPDQMGLKEYEEAFSSGMEERGAAVLGVHNATSDDAKMGGMETDVIVFGINHKTIVLHFVAVDNKTAYSFECITNSLLPKQNKANMKTCLDIETSVKINRGVKK